MTARASELVDRMRAVAAGSSSSAAPGPAPAIAGAGGDAAARKRFTLDLDPRQHRFLRQHALDAGTDARRILCTLLTMLEEDDGGLAGRLAGRLAAEAETT